MVPLVLSLLTTFLPPIIQGVQGLFGHNNGTGATKKGFVTDLLTPFLSGLVATGKLPSMPTADEISAIIEAALMGLKTAGVMPMTPAPGGMVTMPLPANLLGQTLTFQVTLLPNTVK